MKAPAFRKLDRLAVWTLVLGLVLAALLPPAVRPLRAASGTLEMVLCSGHGPVSVILDLGTGKPLDRLPASDDRHCSWACCHLAAPGAALPAGLPLPVRMARAARIEPPPAILRDGHVTGLPPATGPPVTAVT
ncbi:hypothetical protein [Rhodobacter capsulatus]|uniref:hypothetical protein n=1 Tax=Rhodobacter capsulatus TaxID=1061 RepID=UPI00402862E1